MDLRLPPGTVVAGMTVVRVIGQGPRGAVHEATQPELGRRVCLKVYPRAPGLTGAAATAAWPRHRHVCPLYTAGESARGVFTATRLVVGPSLGALLAQRSIGRETALARCDEVEAALRAAHAAGGVHGAVSAANVLVDPGAGALLTDFAAGIGHDATPADDLDALAGIRALCGAARPEPQRARTRWAAIVGAVAGLAVLAGGVVLVSRDAGDAGSAVPAPPHGAVSLGSPLAHSATRSLDCAGQAPSGASPACTLLQIALPGARVVAGSDGAIRGWVVWGAQGDLGLRVIRRTGSRYVVVASSAWQHAADAGVHRFTADLPARRGDLIGVELAPGATIGLGTARARTARFTSPLSAEARAVDPGSPATLAHELLLRADVVPGARAAVLRDTSGTSAKGQTLASAEIEPGAGPRTLAVVRAGRGIYLDLLADGRRLSRVPVDDADPDGRLSQLDPFSFATPIVAWRNPDGSIVRHTYAVTATSLVARD